MRSPQVFAVIVSLGVLPLTGNDNSLPETRAATEWEGHIKCGAESLEKADFRTAIFEFKQALESIPQSKGPALAERALAAQGLGIAYCRLGHYSQAEVDFLYALAVWHDLSETDTARVALALTNLGTACFYTGRIREALHHHREALRINEKIFGPGAVVVATDLNNIAMSYIQQGRYSQAEPLLRRAIEIGHARMGNDRRLYLFMRNLAGLYERLRGYEDARLLLNEILALQEREGPRAKPATGATLTRLAFSELALKRCEPATAHAREAISILAANLGEEHPQTIEAYWTSGRANECLKRFELAERALARAVRLGERQEHPGEQRSVMLRDYARVLRALHRIQEAKRYEAIAANMEAAADDRSRHVVDLKELER